MVTPSKKSSSRQGRMKLEEEIEREKVLELTFSEHL